ncbi:uncharacterized protein LOC127253977 isoform X2 [Andrographis paniculata]|nr:uncharacterized protein LOC127253977 isoform X2 [Andrographis paniculata]XP_051134769.1 uncharacterized protein LOC127253977 isoform X2 [Andrographis paniculata]
MVQTLESIRGGGGSIKVGTTGTISALMSRELDSAKSATKAPSSITSVSVMLGNTSPRKLKTIGEASSSTTGSVKNHKSPETTRRTKRHGGHTHHIPMLTADNMSLDGTPMRQKPIKKGPNVVEIVDLKCGNPDRNWVNPITNRLKKLGFSKLSESSTI